MTPVVFPYTARSTGPGLADAVPLVPLTMALAAVRMDVNGLLDSGASVNVLPHSVGLRLGADWARQTTPVPLGGGLAGVPARALLLTGIVAPFPPVPLVFAWAASDAMPILLGQMNFFEAFDVCFHRSRLQVEISPAARPTP